MGANDVGDLRIRLGVDADEAKRGLNRAKQYMKSFAGVAKNAGIVAGASFAAATAGITVMTRQGLEAVDAQAKLARTVDGSIDGMRALQIVAGDAGASQEEIGQAAQMAGKRLAEAARDGFGPAHEALQMLGLDAQELLDMDVDARFALMADRAKDLGLSAQQSADLMRQFGVRSSEVALVLAQGGDAIRAARQEVKDFGLSMSAEAAAGVEVANDALSRISFVFEGLRNQLAVSIAPLLQDVADRFKVMAADGGPLQEAVARLSESFAGLVSIIADPRFIEAATTFGVTLANAISGLSSVLVVITENAELAGAAMVALGGAMAFFMGPTGLAIAAIAAGVATLATRLGQSAESAKTAEEAERDLVAALSTLDTSNADAVASGEDLIATHIDQARAAIEAAKAEYTLARAEADRAVSQAKMRKENMPGNFFADDEIEHAQEDADGVTEYYSEVIAEREAQLERYQKVLEGFKRSQFPSRGAPGASDGAGGSDDDPLGAQKLRQDLDALINKLDPAIGKAKQYDAALALLKKGLDEGELSQADYNARVAQLDELYAAAETAAGGAAAGIKKVASEANAAATPAQEFAQGMDQAFGNLINTLGSSKDALKNFGIEVVRLLAIRGISSILGSSDWFSGSLFSSVGANANGTDHWSGGLSWVGERGPELVNLPRGAQVIPNHRLGGGGGAGQGLVYAPKIDARGASLEAVNELKQQMRADAAQFELKVRASITSLQKGRML